jgi:cell division protein FtsB
MTNASVTTAPARSGDIGSPASRRPPFVARRRLLVVVSLLVLVGLAVLANYGPVRDYRDARARLEKRTAEVAALEAQKVELQSQLGRLGEAGYLESLARQELTYVRPGEDLFIVTGLAKEDASATDATAGGAESLPADPESAPAGVGDRPGPLERILSAIGGLF